MKKNIALPLLALAGGVVGFLLRRWQWTSAYRPEVGLFVHGAPATWTLLGLLTVLALAFLLLLFRTKREELDFLPAFGSSAPVQMTVLTAAGLLLLAAGALGIQAGLADLRLWRELHGTYQLSNPVAQLLTGVLCIPGGLGILLMGKMAFRWELSDAGCLLAPCPALMGVVWLFTSHLQCGTEPVLMKYGLRMGAVCLLTLAHYDIAAFLFTRPHPRRTAFFCLTGAVLGLASLGDGAGLFSTAALLACALSALGFASALLAGPWPERMPPDQEPDGPQADQSITEG